MVYKLISAGVFVIIFILLLTFNGCINKGWNPCEKEGIEEVELLLPKDFQWEVWQQQEFVTTANSQNGLEESFYITQPRYRMDKGAYSNCTNYFYESVSISYESTIYNHSFNISLTKNFDDVLFKLSDVSSGYYGLKVELQYLMIGKKGLAIELDDPTTAARETTSEITLVNHHDSLKINQQMYYNIYEIENAYFKKKGEDKDVVTFFFSEEKGLVKFVQKGGIEWFL